MIITLSVGAAMCVNNNANLTMRSVALSELVLAAILLLVPWATRGSTYATTTDYDDMMADRPCNVFDHVSERNHLMVMTLYEHRLMVMTLCINTNTVSW